MHILFAHNFYRLAGGEDTVLQQEKKLLENAGHSVDLHSINNDQIKGVNGRIRTVINIAYSRQERNNFSKVLDKIKPDIVHVHNFFPLLTPAIYDACREGNIPVVQTLHNYRIMCANALLLRDGKVCESCINNSPYIGALYRCYRNSFLGSLAVAHFISKHQNQNTWSTKIDRVIALTEFSRNKFIQSGVDPSRIVVKPNFIEDPLDGKSPVPIKERTGMLFVGRLSEEKGIRVLLEAWKTLDVPLTVVGDGPLRSLVEQHQQQQNNIHLLGSLPRDQVAQEMAKARALVVPSIWYEGFPMVLLEAFAQGLPVIATDLGNVGQIVEKHSAGTLFSSGEVSHLESEVYTLYDNIDELQLFSDNCRAAYESEYTPVQNLQQLEAIYKQVILLANSC
jgi:glycosyltransferase involved in cell wall biosynthesis